MYSLKSLLIKVIGLTYWKSTYFYGRHYKAPLSQFLCDLVLCWCVLHTQNVTSLVRSPNISFCFAAQRTFFFAESFFRIIFSAHVRVRFCFHKMCWQKFFLPKQTIASPSSNSMDGPLYILVSITGAWPHPVKLTLLGHLFTHVGFSEFSFCLGYDIYFRLCCV